MLIKDEKPMASPLSRDLKNRFENLPFAVIGIIAINVLVAIFVQNSLELAIRVYGLVPSHPRIDRMLSSNFVHDGFVHLGVNMTLLYLFGRSVEKAIGSLEFLIFYLGACMAASAVHLGIVYGTLPPYYSDIAVVGASGAVAGVMGMFAVRFHRKTVKFGGMELPVLFLILCWLIVQLGLGIIGLYCDSLFGIGLKQVSYWSHLGGFAFGIIIALITDMALQGEREYLISEAKANYDEGNILEAARNYETLLKYDPDNPYAHAELGRLWAILEEKDQSLPYYHVAIELYARHGNGEDALDRAEEMRRFWPGAVLNPDIRFRLASYLEEDGNISRAIGLFKNIVKDSPDSVEAQMSLLKIGQIQLCSLSDSTSAGSTLKGFLDRYPSSEWRKYAEETIARIPSKKSTPSRRKRNS